LEKDFISIDKSKKKQIAPRGFEPRSAGPEPTMLSQQLTCYWPLHYGAIKRMKKEILFISLQV